MNKFALLIGLLLIVPAALLAQSRIIKGTITDDAGVPVPQVSIQVKNSTRGTFSDVNGNFSITLPEGTDKVTLVITSTGYKSQEIVTDGKAPVNVLMQNEASHLDDVVVIGYGTARKGDLTGSVSSISSRDLEKIPVSSAAEAITGRMPGVLVTTTDGAPGAEIVIRVRGGGSVTQDNSPLYIVDGFPVDNINDIAPADIASIDVLKDAATSAIYGARGANGVVIVTTKSGRPGKTVVSYNGFGQARYLPRKLDVLSPYEFVLAQYEYARLRSQTDVDNFTRYFGAYEDLELYKYQEGTDWQEELYGGPVYAQQHNLSLSGGSAKTKMSLSVTNNTDEGLLPGSGYMRNFLNFKINHEISPSIKLDFNTRFTHTVTDGAGSSGTSNFRIGDAITTRPVNGLADVIEIDQGAGDDDYEQFLKSRLSPAELIEQDYRKRVGRTLNINAGITWEFLPQAKYTSQFGLDLGDEIIKRYYGPLTGTSRNVGGNLPLGDLTNRNARGWRWTNTVLYSFNELGKHNLSIMGGQELVVTGKGFSEFTRSKFFEEGTTPDKLFATMALGEIDQFTTYESAGAKLASFFGRLNYNFDSRFLLTLTLRADGSTKFAAGKQWGYFPAAAVAWRISNEKFMENLPVFNDLKMRFSYGAAGNNRLQNDLFRVLYTPSVNRPIGFGDEAQPYYTYASSLLPNPDIKWETTITRNLGLDFSLFRSRLSGSLDFYWNTTKDLLVEYNIPQTTGFSTQMQNVGQTSNRGIELALTGVMVSKRDFDLSATFNVGMNRAKIDDLGGDLEKAFNSNWAGTDLKTQDDYRVLVGSTIGLMYGYVADGMYTPDDFASYNPTNNTYTLKPGVTNIGSFLGGISLRPGVLKLKDLDSNGIITAADRQVIGSALPKATGGFGLNARYKQFDFSAFFTWSVGNDVYNSGRISFNMLYRTSYGNMLNTVNYDNRFRYIDADGNLVAGLEELAKLNPDPKIWSPFSSGTASPVFHSGVVEDGSYLRLSNVSVGYSLPQSLASKILMSKFRIYATVYNAFLWTNYTGYDPDVSVTRNSSYSQLTPGVDFSGYPKSRGYTVGVNVTFK